MVFILTTYVNIHRYERALEKVSTVSFGTRGRLVTSELQNRLLFVRFPETRKF